MVVHHVHNNTEFQEHLTNAGGKLVVIDFFATWCGPCKRISPFLEQLSDSMSNVHFLKVDVDEAEEIARNESVSAMPTFVLYKNGKRVTELVGASQDKLKELIVSNA